MSIQDIVNAWALIRKIDQTIPDEVLDFMKNTAIDRLQRTSVDDLKVWTFNTESQDTITLESSYAEMQVEIANGNGVEYDLGRYFEDQNDDNIGSHWSFLVNTTTGQIVNGKYNAQI